MTISHGVAHHIAMTSPATLVNDTAFSTQPVVTIQDQDNNTVTTGSDSTQLVTLSSTDATIGGTYTMNAVAGVANFSGNGVKLTGLVGTRNLTATISSPSTLIKANSVSLTVGAADHLAFGTQAAGAVNGTVFTTQPVVNIVDISGNQTTSTATVSIASSGPTLGGTYSKAAVAGTATFTDVKLTGTSGSLTLTYSATGVTDLVQSITLVASDASQLLVTVGSTLVNDTVFSIQPIVTIKDANGNVVTSGAQSTQLVTLSSTDATIGGTVSMNAVNGVADFTGLGIKLTGLVGSRNLTATISSPSTITGTASVTITYGAATQLAITTQADGAASRKVFTTQPVIKIQDVSGNTVENATNTINFTSSTNGHIGTRTKAAVNGVATYSGIGTAGTAGTVTLTFSATGFSNVTQSIQLTHGDAYTLYTLGQYGSQSARGGAVRSGTNFYVQPKVTIADQDGNVVTTGSDSTQNVTVSASPSGLTGTTTIAAVAGIATFTDLKITGTIGRYDLTYTISSPSTITGTDYVTLTAGTATKVVVVTGVAGFENRTDFTTQPVTEIQDSAGNRVSNSAQVTVSISSGTLTGTTTVTSVNGTATFSGLGKYGTVGTKTLTFSSGVLTSDTTQVFTLTHGVVDHLAMTSPTNAASATAFATQPIVTIQDQDNNTITTGSDSTQRITLSSTNGTLSGVTYMYAVAGVADFVGSGIKLTNTTGTYNLTASISSPSSKTVVNSVILGFGAPHHVTLTTAADGAKSRKAFTTQPVVTIRDAAGNTVTNSAMSVSVDVIAGTLNGTTTINAVNGIATFSGIGLQGGVGTYRLNYYSSVNGIGIDTQTIALDYGDPAQLSIQASSSSVNNVVLAIQPEVTIQDADGNTITAGAASSQQVTLSSSDATISGTLQTNAVSGVADFSGMNIKLVGLIGNRDITATISNPSTIVGHATVSITYGAPAKLHVTTLAAGFANRANFSTQPVVTIEDISGNRVEDSNFDVTASMDTGGVGGLYTINAVNGVAAFTTLSKYGPVGQRTITFSTSNQGIASDSQTFTLTHGFPHHIAVTTPGSVTNGTVFATQPVATIQDPDNNTVSTGSYSTLNITLSASDSTIAGTLSMDAVAGVADFNGKGVKLTGLVGTKTLTATITNPATITGSTTLTLDPGTASKLAFKTQAAGFANRTDFTTQPEIYIQDASGNTVTSSTASVTVAIDSGNLTGTGTVAAVNGVATFSGLGKNGTVGQKILDFTSSGLTHVTQTFTLTHGAVHHIVMTSPSTLVNDTAFGTQPVVTIQDEDNNTVTTGSDSTQTVTLSSTDASIGGTYSMSAVAGVANFTGKGVTLRALVGSRNLTATISSPATKTVANNVTITYGAAAKLAVTTQGSGVVNRVAFTTQPVITVQDVSGNTVTSSSDVITAAVGSGPALGGTLTATASSGVATFSNLKLTGSIGTYTLTFSSGSLTSTSHTIDLAHGEATQMVMTLPSSAISGAAMGTQPLVTIKDADGNVVSTGSQSTQTVTISIATGATLTGTASMSAVAGVADFTGKGITLTGAVGSKVLTATISSPSNITTTASVSLSFGVASKLAINQATVSATNRVNFTTQPVVTVQDANGNTISDSTAAISVTVDSANVTLGGSTSVNAVSGVYTFSGSKLSGTAGTYTITYASSGLTSVTQTVTLVAGAVDHITLSASTTAQNAIALSAQPTVTSYDIDNNVTTAVTQSVSIAATGATLSGTDSESAVAGIADFTGNGLALTGTVGTKTLTASVVINGTTFTSNSLSIQLNAGNATKLGLTQSALGAASRKVIATQPVLEVQDVSGNRVPGRTDTITVSTSGVTLGGDTSMAAVDGTATFANNANGLKLSGTVGTYTLTYAATGLTSATQSIALTFGDASQLTVHTAAADAKAGIAFVTQPVIWSWFRPTHSGIFFGWHHRRNRYSAGIRRCCHLHRPQAIQRDRHLQLGLYRHGQRLYLSIYFADHSLGCRYRGEVGRHSRGKFGRSNRFGICYPATRCRA
jgi:hypothetical protein